MSLHVTLTINDEPIGSISITRQHDDNVTDIESTNWYRWYYYEGGRHLARGHIDHRYGDGAVILASKVLNEITDRMGGVA